MMSPKDFTGMIYVGETHTKEAKHVANKRKIHLPTLRSTKHNLPNTKSLPKRNDRKIR